MLGLEYVQKVLPKTDGTTSSFHEYLPLLALAPCLLSQPTLSHSTEGSSWTPSMQPIIHIYMLLANETVDTSVLFVFVF